MRKGETGRVSCCLPPPSPLGGGWGGGESKAAASWALSLLFPTVHTHTHTQPSSHSLGLCPLPPSVCVQSEGETKNPRKWSLWIHELEDDERTERQRTRHDSASGRGQPPKRVKQWQGGRGSKGVIVNSVCVKVMLLALCDVTLVALVRSVRWECRYTRKCRLQLCVCACNCALRVQICLIDTSLGL